MKGIDGMKYKYNGNEFLKRLKEVSGITTQNGLADKLGVTQGTISKLKTAPPSGDTLLRIASNVGCSIDYLMGIDVKKEPDKEPTYPDLLHCVDALVKNGLGEFTTVDSGETEGFFNERGELEEYSIMHRALILKNSALWLSFKEYEDLSKALSIMDSAEFAAQLKAMWFSKEDKKDVPLTAAGMKRLSAMREFADPVPEE